MGQGFGAGLMLSFLMRNRIKVAGVITTAALIENHHLKSYNGVIGWLLDSLAKDFGVWEILPNLGVIFVIFRMCVSMQNSTRQAFQRTITTSRSTWMIHCWLPWSHSKWPKPLEIFWIIWCPMHISKKFFFGCSNSNFIIGLTTLFWWFMAQRTSSQTPKIPLILLIGLPQRTKPSNRSMRGSINCMMIMSFITFRKIFMNGARLEPINPRDFVIFIIFSNFNFYLFHF